MSEPGYYEDENFGIRLENVLVIKEAGTKFNFADKGYLSFEHITWVSSDTSIFGNHLNLLFVNFFTLFEHPPLLSKKKKLSRESGMVYVSPSFDLELMKILHQLAINHACHLAGFNSQPLIIL